MRIIYRTIGEWPDNLSPNDDHFIKIVNITTQEDSILVYLESKKRIEVKPSVGDM